VTAYPIEPQPIDASSSVVIPAGVPSSDPEPSQLAGARTVPARGHLLPVPDLTGFHELRIWAESYEDVQRARIACENRMERGGVPPEVFATQRAALRAAEHELKLGMGRCYRRVVPAGIRAWQESTFGIGAHLAARLLGALGHPRIATPFHWEGDGADRTLVADEVFERSVRQLWQYCGHGAPLRRRKGMTVEEAFELGSPRCKMLVHLLAEASMKCRVPSASASEAAIHPADPATSPHPSVRTALASETSAGADLPPDPPIERATADLQAAGREPSADQSNNEAGDNPAWSPADRRYRHTYDARRAATAQTHPEWTDGHSHNDALRIVGKHILADLWKAAQ
jgi:hypothetical protein